jgi:F-type H+-transporting ATPase subunit epsilon
MASTHTPFPARIVTPEGMLFEGNVRELEVSSVAGGLGILARRAPIVADLKIGQIRAELEDGTWRTWATDTGFAQASNSTATVVVEEAIALEDIDVAKAEELIAEGEARVAEAGDNEGDIRAAQRTIHWGRHLLDLAARR